MAIAYPALLFVILLSSVATGWWVQHQVDDRHVTPASVDAVRLLMGMLLTFSALVLGLLTSKSPSGKSYWALHSLLTISLIEARRRKATPRVLRFSQSLARRRQRFSQAMVRSTIHRFGKTAKPLA